MKPTAAQRKAMYSDIVRSREFDDRVLELYFADKMPVFDLAKGVIPGEIHSSHGQEPCAAGTMPHLTLEDTITSNHRPHHHAICRGLDLNKLAAELMGKKTGYCAGKGGHMHIYSVEHKFSCSGIIAEGMGPAAGVALANKMRQQDGIAVSYMGEAAANQSQQSDRPKFGFRSQWDLVGTVEHWGHIHERTNKYDARFQIELVDGQWKITRMQVLDESQGPVKTSLRKF